MLNQRLSFNLNSKVNKSIFYFLIATMIYVFFIVHDVYNENSNKTNEILTILNHYDALKYDCLQVPDGITEKVDKNNWVIKNNAPITKCFTRYTIYPEDRTLMGRVLLDTLVQKTILDLKLNNPQAIQNLIDLINKNYGSLDETISRSNIHLSTWNLFNISYKKVEDLNHEKLKNYALKIESGFKAFEDNAQNVPAYADYLDSVYHDNKNIVPMEFNDFLKTKSK